VLLRPGPYICAEWDAGGLPPWLLAEREGSPGALGLRSSEPRYLQHVARWWGALFSRLQRYAYQRGGPIVAVQIENECGAAAATLPRLAAAAARAAALLARAASRCAVQALPTENPRSSPPNKKLQVRLLRL
jgi:beta-galactosidase GanA